MNTTLNIDSASRVLAPDGASWATIERTESERSLTECPEGCPGAAVALSVRALLHVIAGVFAILYALGAPTLVIVLLVYMFTR
jgi:hypothetical protein